MTSEINFRQDWPLKEKVPMGGSDEFSGPTATT